MPASPPPLDAMLAVIPSLPRPVLSRLVSRLIDRLDEIDPDPDAEAGAWNERPSQAKWPRDRALLAFTEAEADDDDSGVDDTGEWTDEREPEPYDGGQADPPLTGRFHLTA